MLRSRAKSRGNSSSIRPRDGRRVLFSVGAQRPRTPRRTPTPRIRPPAAGPSRSRRDQRRWRSRMRPYEVMVIFDPDTEERSIQPTLERHLAVITKGGGTVDNLDIWGRRRLAYEIRKKSEGIYAVINLTAQPADVKELDRKFTINESIMRTKVIRPDKH